MAHPDRLHLVHRAPLPLLVPLITLLIALTTLVALTPATAADPQTAPGPATAPGPSDAPATAAAGPAVLTVAAPVPGEPVGWREAAQLLSLTQPAATAIGPRATGTAYRLPVPDAVVRAGFDAPVTRWARGHRGIDLGARAGAEVLAPQGGVVQFAGTVVDRGVVTIEHADGLRSSLEPVLATVQVGMRVRAGQALGTVQTTASHCRPQACVHWGVRDGTTYLDPLSLLPGSGPVVLLPVPQG